MFDKYMIGNRNYPAAYKPERVRRRQAMWDASNARAGGIEGMLPDDGVLTFGKFKGESIFDVEPAYVQWACEAITGFAERYAVVEKLHALPWRMRPSHASLPLSGRNSQGASPRPL